MKRPRTLYFIVANTAILLLVIELGTHVAITAYHRVAPTVSIARPTTQLSDVVKANYAHMAPADVDELLRATNSLRFQFAPWVGPREGPMTSGFVNVGSNGVRANGPTPRGATTIQNAVWFFGGSTTFGFGLADHETIPAQLEQLIGQPVVNFGVRGDNTAQENLQLNHHLRIGYRPAVAIFLDGINEVCLPGVFQREMTLLLDRWRDGYDWAFGYPVTYAYAQLSKKLKGLTGVEVDQAGHPDLTCVSEGRRSSLRSIQAPLLAEREVLCRLYKIECRTLVQPFAGLHGRHDDSRLLTAVDRMVLRDLFIHLEPNWRAAGAIFVTDALDHYDRHAFIDEVHYSADASRWIAERVADRLGLGRSAPAAP